MRRYFILMLILCFVGIAFAATQRMYVFQSPQKREQFSRLTHELRCMVCQNENIAASTAGFAADMREKVYQMVGVGKSDNEIKHYMTARYGNFILFKPPFIKETYLLWFMPVLLLLLGLIVSGYVIRKYRGR